MKSVNIISKLKRNEHKKTEMRMKIEKLFLD